MPVYLVWSNTHGGVLGGLATMAFVVGGWSLLGLVGRDSPATSLGRGLELWLIVLACSLTSMATPYGAGCRRRGWRSWTRRSSPA